MNNNENTNKTTETGEENALCTYASIFSSFGTDSAKDIILGKFNGLPVRLDLNNAPNRHICLIGSSGCGKTFEALSIIRQIVTNGGRVLALESHGSLSKADVSKVFNEDNESLCNHIWAVDEGIPCGILYPITYPDGTTETRGDVAEAFTGIITKSYNLGIRQRAALRKATEKAFRLSHNTSETLNTIERILESGNRSATAVAEILHPLFDHKYFVDGISAFSPHKFNLIHLDKISPDVQEAIPEIMISLVWRLANAGVFKDYPLWLFVDEFQNYGTRSNNALAQLISEGRKLGVNLILGSQLILQNTDKAVQQRVSQCGLMLYGKPMATRISQEANMINRADPTPWFSALKNLKVGQFVAVGNYCIGQRPIDYPIVIDARVKM